MFHTKTFESFAFILSFAVSYKNKVLGTDFSSPLIMERWPRCEERFTIRAPPDRMSSTPLIQRTLYTLQTIFSLCVPKIDLAKPHFKYHLYISKTEL
jgi:hypothetical protein